MPKVSIIMPVYNVEKYLKQALDSAVNQTLNDIEIICVDDCSTDNSLNILKEYQLKDSRIKVIEQKENKGQGVARNIALDIASGEYIMFLDPDDWLELNACEIAYNQISRNKNDIVFYNFCFYSEKSNRVKSANRINTFKNLLHEKQIELYKIQNFRIYYGASIWTQIYKRSFINDNNIRFSKTRTCEDNPFFFKALVCAKTVSAINLPLYFYRTREVVSLHYVKAWRDVLQNKLQSYEIIKKSQYKNEFMPMFIIYYWNSLVYGHFNKFRKADKNLKPILFEEIHKTTILIENEINIENIKEEINYIDFLLYKYAKNLWEYRAAKLLTNLLHIKHKNGNITARLLGIKVYIKRNKGKNNA